MRRGQDKDKLALLYEVVAEDTSEEGTSMRRRGEKSKGTEGREKHRQLEIVQPLYGSRQQRSYQAADHEVKYSTQSPKSKIQTSDNAPTE